MTHTEIMPAIYTHYAVANALFNNLPSHIQKKVKSHLSLYFFGAQGADFCFFYHVFGEKAPNLGSHLHRTNTYEVFRLLKAFSNRSNRLFAYALGYLTHYATDVTFHPYVYATAGSSYTKHTRLENALDVHFKPLLHALPQKRIFKKPSLEEEIELYILYAAIARKTNFPPLLKSSFSRAISLFNAYPPISSNLYRVENKAYLQYACNVEKRSWKHPSLSSVTRNDSADELFDKALSFAQELSASFCLALQENTPLPLSLFNKHFLTGV